MAHTVTTVVPERYRPYITEREALKYALVDGTTVTTVRGSETLSTFMKLAAIKDHYGQDWEQHTYLLHWIILTEWPHDILNAYNRLRSVISLTSRRKRVLFRPRFLVQLLDSIASRALMAEMELIVGGSSSSLSNLMQNPDVLVYICAGNYSAMNNLMNSNSLINPLSHLCGRWDLLIRRNGGSVVESLERLVNGLVVCRADGGRLTRKDIRVLLQAEAMGWWVLKMLEGRRARAMLFIGETAAMIQAWRLWGPGLGQRVVNVRRSVGRGRREVRAAATTDRQLVMAAWINSQRVQAAGYQVHVPAGARDTTPMLP